MCLRPNPTHSIYTFRKDSSSLRITLLSTGVSWASYLLANREGNSTWQDRAITNYTLCLIESLT